jgi:hypothetical protein
MSSKFSSSGRVASGAVAAAGLRRSTKTLLDLMAPEPHLASPLLWFAQAVVFAVVSVPAFFVGWYAALMPCLLLELGLYCSAHGGFGQLLGLVLGLICAVTCGHRCARRIGKAGRERL